MCLRPSGEQLRLVRAMNNVSHSYGLKEKDMDRIDDDRKDLQNETGNH